MDAKALSRNDTFRMRVTAVRNGLPFLVAFLAPKGFVAAWVVAAGEMDGGSFIWGVNEWAPSWAARVSIDGRRLHA